jgi:glucokinase
LIFGRARRGGVASEVVNETVRVLGLAIANLITVLNPEAVIFGGSVAEVGPLLMDPLAARVRQYAYPASVRRVRISAAQLGGDAPVLGAVALAVASLRD